jgi:hypothetical protein
MRHVHALAVVAMLACCKPPGAAAATITLANQSITISGELREADRVEFAQRLGRWLASTGRHDLTLRLERVHGDPETAKRILRFLATMMESGLVLAIEVERGDPCPAACAVLRDGYDDAAFLASLEAYRGYRIQVYEGRWVAAPSAIPR